jgi:ketosteroid isomerase-like protein
MGVNLEVVMTYFRSVDAEDLNALESLFSPDAILLSAGAGQRSGERILSFYRNVFLKYPEHRDVPSRILEIGDTVVAEILFTGRSATGVRVEFPAVDIFDLRDGKILRLSQWIDTAALQRQLAQQQSSRP